MTDPNRVCAQYGDVSLTLDGIEIDRLDSFPGVLDDERVAQIIDDPTTRNVYLNMGQIVAETISLSGHRDFAVQIAANAWGESNPADHPGYTVKEVSEL